ncbi:hypothetical protein ACVCIH_30555 [Burkholderia glumae]
MFSTGSDFRDGGGLLAMPSDSQSGWIAWGLQFFLADNRNSRLHRQISQIICDGQVIFSCPIEAWQRIHEAIPLALQQRCDTIISLNESN